MPDSSPNFTPDQIAEALGGAYRSGSWWRCRCPAHGAGGSSLALRLGQGGLEVRCFGGCCRTAILAKLQERGLIDATAACQPPDPATLARQREAEARDRAKRLARARWLWRETVAPNHNHLIDTYLGGRFIFLPVPPTIRLHPSFLHYETQCRRPAMVGAVKHTEHGFVGIHVTYLRADGSGKATALEPVKRTIGPIGGGAVRLAPATDRVAVTEGIETGLSYMEGTGIPTWAALSTSGIAALILPPRVRHVAIACDADPAGIAAAQHARHRWRKEGRHVVICRPPPGRDFNDLARESLL